jgi:hemin uptake protein HemP
MKEIPALLANQQKTTPAIASVAGKKPRIESQRLFQGKSEIIIVHETQEYNLRITKNGKLILTK